MSLFVAVTLVPVLCAKWLRLPKKADERRGISARLFATSERVLNSMDDFYRDLLHRALNHRPTIVMTGAALFVIALLILPTVGFELMPQTDEGEVTVDAELAGRLAHRPCTTSSNGSRR